MNLEALSQQTDEQWITANGRRTPVDDTTGKEDEDIPDGGEDDANGADDDDAGGIEDRLLRRLMSTVELENDMLLRLRPCLSSLLLLPPLLLLTGLLSLR
jgi:hypothetical protein